MFPSFIKEIEEGSVVNNVHQVEQKIVPVHKIDVHKLLVKDSQVFRVAFGGYKKALCIQ